MAVTTDEILARGNGPVQTTWAGQATLPTIAPTPPQQPKADNEPSGVENVIYDTSNQGAPDNPKNAREVVERGVVNVANPNKPQTTTDVEQVAPVDEQQKGSQAAAAPKLSYTEMFEKMSPYKPPTPEELEKERKRQKREAIFAAIGEGISAMSNLYFTTQYAPNAFDPTSGMAATTKARFDKLKKDREDNQREYMEGYLRAMKMDADQARDDRNYNHTLEREKVTDRYKEAADDRAQAKADRDAAMAELRMELMQGRIDQQTAAARAKEIEANYAEAYWASRISKNNYRPPVRGGSHGSGGSGRPGEYPWYDSDGNKHYAHSYEAMRQNAIDHGTWNEQTQESSSERTTTDRRGKTKGTTSSKTTKPAKGHSSAPQGKKPNPMGGGSGNGGKQKKKNPMS